MPWVYNQRSGRISGPNGEEYQGYSGRPENRNNPTAENVPFSSPIPRGAWRIADTPHDSASTGPYSVRLSPTGHNAHGRTAFIIHGDNSENNASEGCIILPRAAREAIIRSDDNQLTVRE